MRIGVVGAGGRLGSTIVSKLREFGDIEVVPIRGATPHIDAVINAAPLADAKVHQAALDEGCHVVDVTIRPELIRQILALDEVAQRYRRCVIAMAGLAPGLTGLLGCEMLQRYPSASFVQVSLLQSGSGSSGKQGTVEMLDLLTRSDCRYANRPYSVPGETHISRRGLFDFLGPELEFMPESDRIRLVTGFDDSRLNHIIRILARIRRVLPAVYENMRDRLARAKAQSTTRVEEAIEVGAVSLDESGRAIAGFGLKLDSDYGTTAAIASAAALLAVSGTTTHGAGHLSKFVNREAILNHPLVKPHCLNG